MSRGAGKPLRQGAKARARATGLHTVRLLGAPLLRALARSWRVEVLGAACVEEACARDGGCVMALWHGRMLVALPHHAHRDSRAWQVLVSGSEDGDLSERLLRAFGYGVIRGSRSRGGARALRELLAARGEDCVLVITPDGPRGPRHSMNPGLAWLARETGYAVVPCGFVCDRAWHTDSWDRFTIPKPRARLAFVYEEPVRVSPDASEREEELATEEIRSRMLRAEERGFAHLGVERDW